jgi:hypothetical protein
MSPFTFELMLSSLVFVVGVRGGIGALIMRIHLLLCFGGVTG